MIDRDNPQNKERLARLTRLKEELPLFAANCLKIRTKTGLVAPFIFNRAQMYIHGLLERQRANTGRIRALILKGRQQGCSEYVAARFYHQTIFNPGTTTFILSHESKTTGPLFDKVKRYQDHIPDPIAAEIDAANKNQMKFAGIDSEYTVGTAGNEDIGRGLTIKNLHCSEAAFYTRTEELESGLFQAVADMPGTEIIMESTANGMGNMFYRRYIDALSGKGSYIPIFIPWYWQDEYNIKPPRNFSPTPEEAGLQRAYKLTNAQLYWRRKKIEDLKDEWLFNQEYPMNAMEAFVVSGESFFNKDRLRVARKTKISCPHNASIAGVDCARTNDRNAITIRRGREVLFYKTFKFTEAEDITGIMVSHIASYIDRYNLKKVFIDYATGYGIIDGLRALGYRHIVMGVYFGQKALDKNIYANKRIEMYAAARDWFEDGVTDIPDDEDFYTDLLMIPMYKRTPSGKLQLPSKVEIRKKYGRSPDITDSFVLTFAFPVSCDTIGYRSVRSAGPNDVRRRDSELITANRIRKSKSRSTIKVKRPF